MPITWRDGHQTPRGPEVPGPNRPGLARWPRPWPALGVVIGVMILVGLGVFHLDRRADQNRLMARVHARLSVPAAPLPAVIDDPAAFAHRRVTVTGRLLNDHELYLVARSRYGNVGLQVVTPLIRQDGGGVVLVNRGWVPFERRGPGTRALGQPSGVVTIAGVARVPPARGWFTPDNRPIENEWYSLDIPAMARAAGVAPPAPLVVEAGPAYNPGGLPVGGQTSLDLANDHLRYALLWFGLALALVVLYILATWRPDRVER